MQNYGTSGKFELQITGYHDLTTVTVHIPCDMCQLPQKFLKKIIVNKGQMMQVALPSYVEIVGSKLFSDVIKITADKEISVVSMNSKSYSTEIALLYPVNSLGREYYVVTPSTGPRGSFPQFSVFTHQGPNVVDIYPKAQVSFNGKTYSAGSKLTVTLKAFQGIQLQAASDLSGTKIISQGLVTVLSGHVCSWKNTKCNHVFEQLQPVSSWGKIFMVPPLPWQNKNDILYVSASQTTALTYQIGANKQTAKLEGGQVLQILILPRSPVYLSASAPIQVYFYSTGASYQTITYDTLLMEIPDSDKYSREYTMNGQVGFQNFAFLVAKTAEVNGFMVDGKPLINVQWNTIPGTEYSWGNFELPSMILTYRVVHPESPFGLLSVGIANLNSYGTPGAALEREYILFTWLIPYMCNNDGGSRKKLRRIMVS
ncbi:hypothetical protein JD844_005610 [Phrynosoma platyrhinos]|uniref:IgGFc-binding protein N-terminal domain-containing protein n=1 Tax=Phrynosoma platyrhinos TaxID=52577 RepID=A0ABQ7TPB6_PHRPL|nr:hypothetical protein JD844_005610 [Phrynosoma platyrhinos]